MKDSELQKADHMTSIINAFINETKFPSHLKQAIMAPIY